MARIRNMHNLIGSSNFTISMHEQQFMFSSAEDVNNGVMDNQIKSVKINNGGVMMMKVVLCFIISLN
jgi:hypothetical protein